MANERIDGGTHAYVAMRVIACCAAFVDKRFDAKRNPPINTDELIAEVAKQFGIGGRDLAEVFEMREGYVEIPTLFNEGGQRG